MSYSSEQFQANEGGVEPSLVAGHLSDREPIVKPTSKRSVFVCRKEVVAYK